MVKRVVPVLTKTFPQKTWINSEAEGFTLIELLVVLGIIVLISIMVIPNVSNYFQLSLNSATRDLASTIKEAYNSTVLTGKVHRLVYDLKNNSFWVESGPVNALLHTKESQEKEEMRKKFSKLSEEPPKSEFNLETTVTRKKLSLPRGVEFEDILTQQSKTPITEGIAYTHFFPHGVTEQAIIHLKDTNKHHASLAITPLIGMTDLYDRYVNGEEAFGPQ